MVLEYQFETPLFLTSFLAGFVPSCSSSLHVHPQPLSIVLRVGPLSVLVAPTNMWVWCACWQGWCDQPRPRSGLACVSWSGNKTGFRQGVVVGRSQLAKYGWTLGRQFSHTTHNRLGSVACCVKSTSKQPPTKQPNLPTVAIWLSCQACCSLCSKGKAWSMQPKCGRLVWLASWAWSATTGLAQACSLLCNTIKSVCSFWFGCMGGGASPASALARLSLCYFQTLKRV
jgi:hypothetical protein